MIPVVLIHKGNNPYIFNTLYQLKQTNPLVKIYLIGTDESAVYEPMVKHIPIAALFGEAQLFAGIYKHYSTNSESFELMCIQRWFVLKAFMIQKSIQRCLYLDSDVFVYEDVQNLSAKFEDAGMTLCGISGHTNFINQNTLLDFCRFIFTKYNDPEALTVLDKYYNTFLAQHGAGGVSDMTLLTYYAEHNPGITENTYYLDGRPTFDPSLEVGAAHFEMKGNSKKITFEESKPYGILKKTHSSVLFYTLHFQGSNAKKEMVKYIPNKSVLFWAGYVKYWVVYYVQKIKKKVLG